MPFSKDYEREEAFALGVIAGNGPGFPDTLKQFQVRRSIERIDSLTPLADGSERPADARPARARLASLSLSLSIGFGVGVAIAFAAFSLRSAEPVQSASAPALSATPTPAPQAMATVAGASTPSAVPAPSAPVTPLARAAAPRTPSPSPAADRRWLLDRARSEQRQYRLSEAERLYRQVLRRAPRDSEALTGMGELDLLRGTVDLADLHFQEALKANADYIPALVAAADIRWQSGRFDEARQAYRDIVAQYAEGSYPPYVVLRSAATGADAAACR